MNALQWVRCRWGEHARDRKRIWHENGRYWSECAGCRKPMVRDFSGWRLTKDDEPIPPTL